MSEEILAVGRSCNTIAAEIVAITNQAKQIVVSSAIEVGRRLCEAKELVGHGEWGQYVVQLCGMSHRSANNCMKLFKEWQVNPNSQALANFSYTNALRLLSMPEEDREAVLQNDAAPDMSARELDRLAKELAAERKARAEAEEKAAGKKALQQQIDQQKSLISGLKQDLKKAQKASPPADVLEKARQEALAKAREEIGAELKQARAEADAILKKAMEDQEAAARARKEAEAEISQVRQKLENAKKAELLQDADVVSLNATCEQIRSACNVAKGYLMKIRARDSVKADQLTGALLKLLDIQKAEIGGVGDGK